MAQRKTRTKQASFLDLIANFFEISVSASFHKDVGFFSSSITFFALDKKFNIMVYVVLLSSYSSISQL